MSSQTKRNQGSKFWFIAIIIGALFIFFFHNNNNMLSSPNVTASDLTAGYAIASSSTTASGNTGRTVFTISDAAPDMGTITSVVISVDVIQVQKGGNWTTVLTTPQSFDLIQLNSQNITALLADVQLSPGKYHHIRFLVSNVKVTDNNGTHDAKLPSGILSIMLDPPLMVTANSTSVINFDFLAKKSIHITGDGKYILAPVIRITSKEKAELDIEDHENNGKHIKQIKIKHAEDDIDIEVGTDEKGEVGEGLKISEHANVTIENDKIRIRN